MGFDIWLDGLASEDVGDDVVYALDNRGVNACFDSAANLA